MSDYGNLGAFFGAGFDPNSVEPQGDFEVLPPGKYPVIVETAELKPTKAGNGYYIKLQLSILDGHGKGRKLWDQINIANPNQQCVEIGIRCLAALGQAIGLQAISDTNQLLGKACIAHVKVRKDDQRGDQNEIRTYSVMAPASAPGVSQVHAQHSYTTPSQQWAPSQQATPLPQGQAAPPSDKPPWQR